MSQIGPVLPPHLRKSLQNDSNESDSDSEDSFGPKLQNSDGQLKEPKQTEIKRPIAGLVKTVANQSDDSDSDDDYGPALPPHLMGNKQSSARSKEIADSSDDDYGPALPPHLMGNK